MPKQSVGCKLRVLDSRRASGTVKQAANGAVAQLGERRVRNAKVGSSILLRSTIFPKYTSTPKWPLIGVESGPRPGSSVG
jgi:hypothetical protein